MSQPKNLKKLTRARMERTGESYTTARKALLIGKPERAAVARAEANRLAAQAPVEAELPEYPAPEDVAQYDAALWHRVLTQAGITHPVTGQPMSQALLAGLAGGIGFMVFTFEYEQLTTATIVTRAHPEPYTANLLERSGVRAKIRTTGSAEAAQHNLEVALDSGRAVVLRVARAALPWVDPAMVEEADSMDIAVLGEVDELLLVDDGSGELQTISEQDLAAARAKLKREKHWQAWVPNRKGTKTATLVENVLRAIEQTTGRLLGTSELVGIPAHFAKNFGVAGMRSWAERLADVETKKGWSQIFAEPARLEAGLTQLQDFMNGTRFAGPDGLRGQYASFLSEAAMLPGLEALAKHAADYTQLAAAWQELTNAIDPSIAPEQRDALFVTLAGIVEKIADAEQAAATALAATVADLRN